MTTGENSEPTLLVTGAAGFIGSAVSRRLLAEGARVVGLDSFDPYYDRAIKARRLERLRTAARRGPGRWTFLEADIREPWPDSRLAGVDAVLHLAARPGVRASFETPEETRSINVEGTGAVVRALRRAARDGRPRRLVFASSSSVYGEGAADSQSEVDALGTAASPYAESKQLAESLIRTELAGDTGIDAVIARLFTVYGPEQRPDMAISRFVRAALSGAPISLRGDAERDFTWIEDTARGLIAASRAALDDASADELDPGGRTLTVNLGTGRSLTMSRLIAHIQEVSGRPLEVQREPAARGDLRRTRAATERATRRLGWRAEVDIVTGLRRCVEALRDELARDNQEGERDRDAERDSLSSRRAD